jgi:hypothetical protein
LIPEENYEEEGKGEGSDAPFEYLVQDQETFVVHDFENRWPERWDRHYFSMMKIQMAV